MKKLTTGLVITLLVPTSAHAAFLIDDYSKPQAELEVNETTQSLGSTVIGENILGEERDLHIEWLGNVVPGDATTEVADGFFKISNDSTVSSTTTITWDGIDGNPDPLANPALYPDGDVTANVGGVDIDGLGSQNFLGAGEGLLFEVIDSDGNFDFSINTWWNTESGIAFNSAQFEAQGDNDDDPTTPFERFINFDSSLFGETDWESISAFQIVVTGINSSFDVTVDTAKVSEIPEPTPLSLFGVALAGIGIRQLRQKK